MSGRFSVDPARLYDQAQTRLLVDLFAVPRDARDAAWLERFLDAAWTAALATADPAFVAGPDGFGYLRLDVPAAGPFTANAMGNLAQFCLDHGAGMAFFASPSDPLAAAQYVLPMGWLDSLLRFGGWAGDPQDAAEMAGDTRQEGLQTVTMQAAQRVMLGTPSAQYLPPYAARALLRHLRDGWGIAEPRVRLMVNPALRPARNLVIGRKLSEFSDAAAAGAECRRLTWYLPPNRTVVLMPEDWRLEDMVPLQSLCGGVA